MALALPQARDVLLHSDSSCSMVVDSGVVRILDFMHKADGFERINGSDGCGSKNHPPGIGPQV